MRRIAVAAMLLVCMAAAVSCQTMVVVGPTITVQWDAPALGAIPASEVSYEVYVAPYPGGLGVLVAAVASLEQDVTFSVEGAYRLGVRTKRTVAADGAVLFSATAWSEVIGTPAPWYAVYHAAPPAVTRVRIK